MKKIRFLSLFLSVWLLPFGALAQTVLPTNAFIVFTANSSEVFAVYVDGLPLGNVSYNNTQQQVTLSNVSIGIHDITVRLIRPTDRIAHITIDYQQQPLYCNVYYDATSGRLSILTDPAVQLPTTTTITPTTPATTTTPVTPLPTTDVIVVQPPTGSRFRASEGDILGIVERMKKTTFENDKLQLAKSFVKGKYINTPQAIQIAQALRFESKRLEFLLYAYDYCYDRENYYTAADILNFNSNKQKLLKRIQHASPHRRPQSARSSRRY